MFESVVNLIPKYLNKYGLSESVKIDITILKAKDILRDIFGNKLAEMCSIQNIRKNTLTIKVKSSTMAQELSVYSEKIITELAKNKELKKIKKIVFRNS